MPNLTSQAFETLNQSSILTFEKASEVTTDPYFFIPTIIYFLIPIIVYFIWGAIAEARTSSGNVKIITTSNFWIILVLFIFFLSIALILTIFPIHLKFFA